MTVQLRPLDLAPLLAPRPLLTPFLKWPGGKSQELAQIAALAPPLLGRYIDPFVGGGSVLLAVDTSVDSWANDAAPDLIGLYMAAADDDQSFRDAVTGVACAWNELTTLNGIYRDLANDFLGGSSGRAAVSKAAKSPLVNSILCTAGVGLVPSFTARVTADVPLKFVRMRIIEAKLERKLSPGDLLDNIEGAIRAAFYMAIRARYNRARMVGERNGTRLADFLFLREFAYASMFRFNARGEFNVPYGGVSYNRKSFAEKVRLLFSPDMVQRLANTTWRSDDFEPFLEEAAPVASDFVFVDPPYDSDFSDYDDLPFLPRDQERLQGVLESLPSSVMVVIKETPLIRHLYRSDRWRIVEADKTYMWTIKSRNDRAATHLTITNY